MGQQLVLFGHYNGSGDVNVVLKGKISGQEKTWKTITFLPEVDQNNPEVERLWALSSIEDVMKEIRENGETKRLRKKVVDLGLEYSLVTDYTSMLVVKDEIFENQGIQRRNSDRVQRERLAQQRRSTTTVKNYRIDNSPGNSDMFQGRRSPGIGTGPVGPLFVLIVVWLNRRKQGRK